LYFFRGKLLVYVWGVLMLSVGDAVFCFVFGGR